MKGIHPDLYFSSVYKVNYKRLYVKGYRGLLFDLDNTLAPYDMELPDEKLKNHIKKLKNMGFMITIISNNNKERVEKFCDEIEVHFFAKASKPLAKNLLVAKKEMGLHKSQMVMIGDQLFTDVWAGKTAGFCTILIKPIQKKEQFVSAIKRGLEKIVLRGYTHDDNW